ncbi:transketolase [Alicyclobacillus cycloheptanicus]|uniref:Transketolase n=1 Tax=Alicyclobacillus cycloheptanicus TaxID=1457 RepID=A0ABT9XJR5_9BACL|nr:transketolase [Alicyclobacillus cycloheptanicus]MDQ0190023.1 transketolase [Alicyclobacillus cycloheptanicus]WDM00075.1 transketolase [Alicyclobacillus cycloheptanicus]
MPYSSVDELAVSAIRALSIDAIEKANSGHPGLPLGAAPMAYVLWSRFLRYNPQQPDWFNRDRFVLSAGHGSMLLYSLLHLAGYDVTIDDLKAFRQWGSKTPGHPEFGHTPGVDATAGPLGQGLAMAVGMAMAERFLAARFNQPGHEVVDHYTYVIAGDGDLMEGITSEASSLAGHLGLSKLIVLYDSNDISLDGPTSWTFTENVAERYRAYGWNVLRVEDGNNMDAIEEALRQARGDRSRPTLIEVKTVIGYGAPKKQGTKSAHGEPLGAEEAAKAKETYGWPHEPFHVPEAVRAHFAALREVKVEQHKAWEAAFEAYGQAYPELAQQLVDAIHGRVRVPWDDVMPAFEGSVATRDAFGKVANAIAPHVPTLLGGSADLSGSNKTMLADEDHFSKDNYAGRNVFYGVREHAMGAMLNGITLHGGVFPYDGTFLVFCDYMRPALRLAALMKQPVLHVFTHDSIAVGEDGPTHEPVEQLASLRAIPGLKVFRPADATETGWAVRYALEHRDGPVALVLSRQKLPVLEEVKEKGSLFYRGAYVLFQHGAGDKLVLMASGSEVQLVLEAGKTLAKEGVAVRVVNVPSMELFDAQDAAYRESVLPTSVRNRVAVEMAHPMPWYKYVGDHGRILGLDHFGASAPGDVVVRAFGFTTENVIGIARELL